MRKEIELEIQDREQLLRFKIKEMPATKLESWLIRAILLLAKSPSLENVNLQNLSRDFANQALTLLNGLDYPETKILLDELLACCSRLLDNGASMQVSEKTADAFIEELGTLFKLRLEAFRVNFDFLLEDGSATPKETSSPNLYNMRSSPQM